MNPLFVTWWTSSHPGASQKAIMMAWKRLPPAERALFELTAADDLVGDLLRRGAPAAVVRRANTELLETLQRSRKKGAAMGLYDAVSPWVWFY
jgi:hypothetical protein